MAKPVNIFSGIEFGTFEVPMSVGVVEFGQLTTKQLQRIIETVVDTPVAGTLFHKTIGELMRETACGDCELSPDLTVHDRLLFVLHTRIHSLSPQLQTTVEGKSLSVDLDAVLSKVADIPANIFAPKTQTVGGVKITCKIPTIKIDQEIDSLVGALQKEATLEVKDLAQLREIVGRAFIHELTKYVSEIESKGKVVKFAELTPKERVSLCESLPASLTSVAVKYAEAYKSRLGECLTTDEKHTLTIDGTLFV